MKGNSPFCGTKVESAAEYVNYSRMSESAPVNRTSRNWFARDRKSDFVLLKQRRMERKRTQSQGPRASIQSMFV